MKTLTYYKDRLGVAYAFTNFVIGINVSTAGMGEPKSL